VNLTLTGNKLTGSIPGEIGLLAHLQFFAADDNKLDGTRPKNAPNQSDY
jgi:hypothetical protein